jgi:hypothetical protein
MFVSKLSNPLVMLVARYRTDTMPKERYKNCPLVNICIDYTLKVWFCPLLYHIFLYAEGEIPSDCLNFREK